MENAIAVAERYDMTQDAMTPDTMVRQISLIQHVMEKVMKDGEHYGVIPGCGKKPSLLKAGAEKLSLTFRLAPSYTITQTDLNGGHREYYVKCSLTHIPTGKTFGEGVGACSTMKFPTMRLLQRCTHESELGMCVPLSLAMSSVLK